MLQKSSTSSSSSFFSSSSSSSILLLLLLLLLLRGRRWPDAVPRLSRGCPDKWGKKMCASRDLMIVRKMFRVSCDSIVKSAAAGPRLSRRVRRWPVVVSKDSAKTVSRFVRFNDRAKNIRASRDSIMKSAASRQ